ncbi:hypothetical protein CR151_05670 [Vibrio cholerae]|nr:hypothetical protein CR151_05670 [Vibrio cholerae]
MSDSANLETLNESVQLISSKIDVLAESLVHRMDRMDERIDHSTGLAWLSLTMSFGVICVASIWFFL